MICSMLEFKKVEKSLVSTIYLQILIVAFFVEFEQLANLFRSIILVMSSLSFYVSVIFDCMSSYFPPSLKDLFKGIVGVTFKLKPF